MSEKNEWKSIESAPQTGRTLLLGYANSRGNWRTVRGQWMSLEYIEEFCEDPDDVEAGWFETSAEADEGQNCWPINPTHWMDLPAAPGSTSSAPGDAQDERQPLFWYRPRSDDGYEGPIHNDRIEEVRKQSGAWVPLYPGFATLPKPLSDLRYHGEFIRGWNRCLREVSASVAAPAAGDARAWQGLTDAERDGYVGELVDYGTDFVSPLYSVVESIEKRLREKNAASQQQEG